MKVKLVSARDEHISTDAADIFYFFFNTNLTYIGNEINDFRSHIKNHVNTGRFLHQALCFQV